MSITYTITDGTLDGADWLELIPACATELGLGLYAPPVLLTLAKEEAVYATPTGGVRGVWLQRAPRPNRTTLRLASLAGEADWRLAFALLRQAYDLGGGAVTGEGGCHLAPEDLTDAAARAGWEQTFAPDVAALLRSEAPALLELPLCLPLLTTGGLHLDRAAVPGIGGVDPRSLERVHAYLVARVRARGEAHVSPAVALRPGVFAADWACTPTLVARVHGLRLSALTAPGGDAGYLTLADAQALLGSRIEPCGDHCYLLPALSPTDDAALIDALRELSIDATQLARLATPFPEARAGADLNRDDEMTAAYKALPPDEQARVAETVQQIVVATIAGISRGVKRQHLETEQTRRFPQVGQDLAARIVAAVFLVFRGISAQAQASGDSPLLHDDAAVVALLQAESDLPSVLTPTVARAIRLARDDFRQQADAADQTRGLGCLSLLLTGVGLLGAVAWLG